MKYPSYKISVKAGHGDGIHLPSHISSVLSSGLAKKVLLFPEARRNRSVKGVWQPQERKLYTNRFTVAYIHTSILEGNSCTGPQLLQTLQDGTREFTALLSIICLEDAEAKQGTGTQK